ncbi:MAG: EAL domain-containing protein [Clostridiales bacterium]|nr:EAL domain-containing protein [Clostridiales bacterium]
MINKDYNQKMLERIEISFDKVMPVCAVVAFASAIIIYFSSIPNYFVIVDGVIGVVFLYLVALKNIISIDTKMILTIITAVIIGVLSFADGGFGSAGLLIIMIANVIAVVFSSKRFSRIMAVASVAIFIGLWGLAWVNPVDLSVTKDLGKWVIHLFVMILYLALLHTVVYAVKSYLIENIEELEESVEVAYQYAYFDHLTGLPNNEKFINDLNINTKKHEMGYLVYFTVKNLNLINSIYNDRVGDQVLVKLTDIFNKTKTKDEMVARIGGNEFALWLPLSRVLAFNERINIIIHNLYENFYIPGMSKKAEFYIGCTKHQANDNIVVSCHRTRLALTYAKSHKEDGIVFYDETLDRLIRDEEEMKELLLDAIVNEDFEIHYQHKVDARTKHIQGVEALARWHPNDIGHVSPSTFIPIVENMNQAISFGEMIIKLVFNDVKELISIYGDDVTVSINISPSHLMYDRFCEFLEELLETYEIDPMNIILEVTEDVMIENFESVSYVLRNIKALGIGISLDDFGSGYSSLNYLSILDIDELKIDKSFVDQINKNNKINIMLEMIIRLSQQYQLKVVAEGVESEEQYLKLLDLGCDLIQGYYFSKPMPLDHDTLMVSLI